MDYPEEFVNDYHIMLESEVLVTVRCEQVEAIEVAKAGRHAATPKM